MGQTAAGDLSKLVDLAPVLARAGVWAMKVQLLLPETIASPGAEPYWQTTRYATTQRESFARAGIVPYDGWHDVVDACREHGLVWFCSAFDREAVETAHKLYDPALWKIASGDITNVRLLRDVKATGRPVVVSCGGAHKWEIEQACDQLRPSPVVLLACTLAYPTAPEDAQLGRVRLIERLGATLDNVIGVGYSDHTLGTWAAAAATYAGAVLLEKHAMPAYDRTIEGGPLPEVPDLDMALTPSQLLTYTRSAVDARTRVVGGLEPAPTEKAAVEGARRSLFAVRNLEPGTEILEGDVIPLRPLIVDAYPADEIDLVVGAHVKLRIAADEPIRRGTIARSDRLFV